MRKIISPQNKIIVQIEKKHVDTHRFASGLILYQDTSFHPEEHAAIKATVISVPPCIIKRADYEGFTELPFPGDKVLIRYDVVSPYHSQPDRTNPVHKNLITLDDEDYWLADIMQVFAVQTPHGYRMLNGYVFCDKFEQERSIGEILVLPEHLRTEIRRDKMRVRHIHQGPVEPGDIIYCSPNVAQEYKIDSDKFYIIKQSHLLAKAM